LFVVPSIYMLVARTHKAMETDLEVETRYPEPADAVA
jgi:hypothetical protein